MKKLVILSLFVLFLLFSNISTKMMFNVEELSRPSMFLVEFERIYILEDATVYIYSLKNKNLIKKFGKAGEGPGEFKYNMGNGRPLYPLQPGFQICKSHLS